MNHPSAGGALLELELDALDEWDDLDEDPELEDDLLELDDLELDDELESELLEEERLDEELSDDERLEEDREEDWGLILVNFQYLCGMMWSHVATFHPAPPEQSRLA